MRGSWTGPVADERADLGVRASERVFDGLVWDVRRDHVDLGAGQTVTRGVIAHPGAVGVIVLDDDDRVLLLRQYRHPARSYLWEPPAGLLDVPGEDAWEAARRELMEEAHLRAGQWWTLADFYLTPGASEEAFRCFLARDVTEVPHDDRHEGHGEERDMPTVWLPLDEARDLVLAGRLHNPSAVVGVLAACAARDTGWSALRPADAPWPERSPGR
jgi:ADP-ribose pyrophosphatase